MTTTYVLRCCDGKYYVGKTDNLDRRMDEHFSGVGCEWTKRYPAFEIIQTIVGCDKYDEDKHTLMMMEKYGIDNVRGGSWSTITLDRSEQEMIMKRIATAENKCFKCGKKGHFARECRRKGLTTHKEYNGLTGDVVEWCKTRGRWLVNVVGKSLYVRDINIGEPAPLEFPYGSCFRCGRKSHYSPDCYAKKDIYGNYI